MNLWESLLDTLEEQAAVYTKLNVILQDKQRAITEDNLPQLEEIVAKEGAFIKHIGLLEKKRMEIVEELASQYTLPKESIALSQLSQYLPDFYQDKYNQLKNKIQSALQQASLLNRRNQELLECSLNYVNFSLSLLAGLNNSSVYGQQGQEQDGRPANKSIFDHKV